MSQQLSINNNIPKKSLGQNFIRDENFLLKLDQNIKCSKDSVIIEIGPGKGALTKYLVAKKFKHLYLIEKDKQLFHNLKEKYQMRKNISVINDDALIYDYSYLNKYSNVSIVGNLPFNISSQLLILWLDGNIWPSFFKQMILMFQKEVAQRIISDHNKKEYGKLSVLAQSRCKIEKILEAPATIFSPIPKVDGLILKFIPSKEYKDIDFKNLQLLLSKSFRFRRKKVKTSLKDYNKLLKVLNIDDNLRAENLSVKDYCNLANLMN